MVLEMGCYSALVSKGLSLFLFENDLFGTEFEMKPA